MSLSAAARQELMGSMFQGSMFQATASVGEETQQAMWIERVRY
jgi:hypothetical protein